MPTCRVLAFAILLGAASGALVSAELTVDQAVAARLPHPTELEAAQRLAAAARRLAGASGPLLGGATLSAAAGPRRSDDAASSTDVAIGVDLPLLLAGEEQRALAAAIESAAPALTQAARAGAELEVELAYLAAWRDAEELLLRDRELALLADWLAATRLRVAAGAEAPFRVTVALGEVERVAGQREEARDHALASRLALAALTRLPAGEVRLAAPLAGDADLSGAAHETGVLRRAIELGTRLELAAAALDSKADTARWALTSELASEGEEEVARLGISYRIAPRRERRTVADERLAAAEAQRRRAALEIAALDARAVTARRTLAAGAAALSEEEIEHAFRALHALVAEGKERPTDVLAERRTLVDARLSLLDRRHARAAASAELRTLSRRLEP